MIFVYYQNFTRSLKSSSCTCKKSDPSDILKYDFQFFKLMFPLSLGIHMSVLELDSLYVLLLYNSLRTREEECFMRAPFTVCHGFPRVP